MTPLSDRFEAQPGFTGGRLFDTLFTRGMALVEETASYLDGPGRTQSDQLPREAGLTYSAWSMELTTRLMQAASWLVMQKAVRDGEMRREDAAQRKYRIHRDGPALDAEAQRSLGLPPRFLDLVERSEQLYEQICRLDGALYEGRKEIANPVNAQMDQIRKAAETGAFDAVQAWGRIKG